MSPSEEQQLLDFRSRVVGERSLILRYENGWQVLASHGFPEGLVKVDSQLCLTVLQWCWQNAEALLSDDIYEDERFRSTTMLLSDIRSVLCVPLKEPDGRCKALFYTDYRSQKAKFSYTDLLKVQQWVSKLGTPTRGGSPLPQRISSARPAAVPPPVVKAGLALSTDDWRSFFRMLSTFLSSGISLTRGLAGMEAFPDSPGLTRVAGQARISLEQGLPLSQALAGAAQLPNQHRALLRLGEGTGSLDLVLCRLADHLERVSANQRKLGVALVYPGFLLLGSGILAVAGPIWLLRPQLEMLASQGQELPGLTKGLLWLARGLSWFPTWVVLLGATAFLARKLPALWARTSVQRTAMALPGLGRLLRKRGEYEVATSLALSLEVGVRIMEALSNALEGVSSTLLHQELAQFSETLRQGETLAEAFRQSEVLSPEFCALVEVGEESGKLPQTMRWVAGMAELELEMALASLVALLEPVLLLFGGLVVGVIVIATMLPSLKLVEGL